MPPGTYLLADAGYGLDSNILTPYKGVRYHLREFSFGRDEPNNAKELFNLKHAQARNVVERGIGILRKRFKLLRGEVVDCDIDLFNEVIIACCAIHNICMHDGDHYTEITDEKLAEFREKHGFNEDEQEPQAAIDNRRSDSWRDKKARVMCMAYQSMRDARRR